MTLIYGLVQTVLALYTKIKIGMQTVTVFEHEYAKYNIAIVSVQVF